MLDHARRERFARVLCDSTNVLPWDVVSEEVRDLYRKRVDEADVLLEIAAADAAGRPQETLAVIREGLAITLCKQSGVIPWELLKDEVKVRYRERADELLNVLGYLSRGPTERDLEVVLAIETESISEGVAAKLLGLDLLSARHRRQEIIEDVQARVEARWREYRATHGVPSIPGAGS